MTWVAVAVGGATLVTGVLGNKSASRSAGEDRDAQERMLQLTREDLAPYREYGTDELSGFREWLTSQEGQYRDPTMEEVITSPGYETRLGAIENSAAARGGLFSGNALRDIGEFGAWEFDRTRDRRRADYTDEYNRRSGRLNLGFGAASRTGGLTQAYAPSISNTYTRQGNAMRDMYGGIGESVAGGIGVYQGQQNWNAYLNRAYPKPT